MTTARSLASLQQAFSSGNWHSDLPETCWLYTRKHPSTRSIKLALEVQHCLAGLQSQHISLVDALMRDINLHSAKIELRLLSAELQLGDTLSAFNRLTRLGPDQFSWSQRGALMRLPIVLDWLYRQYPECLQSKLQHNLLVKATLANSLLATVKPTVDQISNPPDDAPVSQIAVVGNAPSILNRKQGGAIDNADLVVRFNQINLSETWAVDVGTRTDLWVISPGFITHKLRASVHAQMLTSIHPLSRDSRYWINLAKQPSRSLSLIEPRIWYELVNELKAPPSSGLLVLRTLNAIAPHANVRCYGFSALATHGKSENHYGDRHRASDRHNWLLEAQLIRALAGQA